MFTTGAVFADCVFSRLLQDEAYVDKFFKTYQTRLSQSYARTTAFLEKYSIPYQPANSGLFIWIDLSQWLDGTELPGKAGDSPELKLTRWLMTEGIYLEPGQVRLDLRKPSLLSCQMTNTNKGFQLSD